MLRWWDGSGWTQHTHPDVTAGAGGAGGSGGEPAAATTTLQAAPVQATSVQGTSVQGTAVQATSVQAAATALQATTLQASAQPSAEWLSRTKPPTGRPTAPQPALPEYPGATVGLAPTAYQPPLAAFAGGGLQQAPVQPGYPQPGPVPPLAGQVAGGDGTQVLFLGGDAWQAPGGPAPGNPYGYAEAQRRRRRRVIIGVSAGTVVAVAAIALIASTLSSSPTAPVADQTAAAAVSPTAAAPSQGPSQSASPAASATPAATATGSLLTDGQAGLSYTQLPAPWQGASCPSTLDNGAFPWTAGEYAVAGQVNGGSTTWYGEACSGLLPGSYGYSGVSSLQSTAENLAQTFSNAYYDQLDHNTNTEDDQPVQVSGHAGWEVTYDVSYTNAQNQGATWTDERAAVVVVDTGTNQPAVFFTSIPATLNEENIAALVSSLQLTSASTTAGQQGSATPAGNGGNGNGGNGGNNGNGSGGNNP